MKTLTTTQAAYLAGVHPSSFARWARDHDLFRAAEATLTVHRGLQQEEVAGVESA